MEIGGASLDPEVREGLSRSWKVLMFVGVSAIVLGVIAITVDNAAQAAALLRGRRSRGLLIGTAHEVVIDADVEQIPVGIDGESVLLPTPVRCQIRPGALRIRVPRDRLVTQVLAPHERLAVLRNEAFSTARSAQRASPRPH